MALPPPGTPQHPEVVEALLRDGPDAIERFATHPELWLSLEWAADRGFCRALDALDVPTADPQRAAHELAVATCRRDPALDPDALAALPVPETGLARVQDAIARLHHGLPPEPSMLDPLQTLDTDVGRNGIGKLLDASVHGGRLIDTFAWTDRPQLADALLRATDPDELGPIYGSRLVVALHRQSDPRLQARFQAICPSCTALADPLADPDGAAMDPQIDPHVLLTSFPRHRRVLLDALERQAERELPGRSSALQAIATVDWDRARAIAESFPRSAQSRALMRFDDGNALSAHLDALGVRDPDPDAQLIVGRQGVGTAYSQLFDCGRVLPAQGEVTLREALVRAGIPAEARVIAGLEGERVTVQLWSGTTRYQRIVEPWDLHGASALAGVLNGAVDALAPERDLRFAVVLGTNDVVWGPEQGLITLDDDGLLPLLSTRTEPDPIDRPSLEDDGDGG